MKFANFRTLLLCFVVHFCAISPDTFEMNHKFCKNISPIFDMLFLIFVVNRFEVLR